MHFADHSLAARLEALVAAEGVAFVDAASRVVPEDRPEALPIAGGTAVYAGPGLPVNQASGLGFAGPVAERDVVALEEFFRARGARPLVNVCPLADVSLPTALSARGWLVDGFENVLVRELEADEPIAPLPPGVEVRQVASEEERVLWAALVAEGFANVEGPSEAELRLARVVAARAGAQLFIGYVDGAPAGTGELVVADGVGWLSADATLAGHRRRGVQRAIQEARLAAARDAGCDLAVTEAAPGSDSQRNMERLGFRIVYTRVDMVAPPS